MVGRRRSTTWTVVPRVAAALFLALAGIAATAPNATAGTYRVLACDAAPGGASGSWHASAGRGMVAGALCPSSGRNDRGLLVRNRVGRGGVRRGARAAMTFAAPPGAALRGVHFDWSGRRVGGEWSLGLAVPGRGLVAGCPAGRSAHCRVGGRRQYRGLGGSRALRIEATCATRGGCPTDPLRGSAERTRVRLAVQSAAVVVSDGSDPNLQAGGRLLRGEWTRGTRPAVIWARDNVGIRALSIEVAGRPHASRRLGCDYARRVPCPAEVRTAVDLRTSSLPDGRHRAAVVARDTAGNERRTVSTIRVDNHAPARVRGIRLVGGEEPRSRNSFDVRWTPPSRQAAPITGARWRICRSGSGDKRRCVLGARRGAIRGIENLSVPSRGTWRLRVWLRDAAGNESPVSASRPVTLRYEDRVATRLRAGIAAAGDRPARRATVPFGTRPLIEGSVATVRGEALGRAKLTIHSNVRGADRWKRVGTVRASREGRFRLRVRRGPSRTFRLAYEGGRSARPSSARVRLRVRARSSIEASRRRVPNGGRVRFSGRLLGRPVPADGKLVQLEAFYRDRWRNFALVRTDRAGRWRYEYRFEATSGRITYPFRARIPYERSYPYSVGYSRVVEVTVNGP